MSTDRSLRPLLVLTALGVALRLAFLVLAGPIELQSDEANYCYLAAALQRFGIYFDHYRYLWPPGFAWTLSVLIGWFGVTGVLVMKLLNLAAAAVIGLTTMLLARRLFGDRCARVAGILWCLYLPLIAFNHFLWTEILFLGFFLPAIYLVVSALQDGEAVRDRRLVALGLCLSAALYIKESPLYLTPVLALLAGWSGRERGLTEVARRGSLVLLVLGACHLPWTLRNKEVYGRWVPVASSIGENFYNGINQAYRNFDLTPYDRSLRIDDSPGSKVREWFVDAPPGWDRDFEIKNTIDRSEVHVERGLAYARENPGWFVRSRVKKLADLVAPNSFFLRHLNLGLYEDAGSVFARPGIRQVLVLWALLAPILVLLLSPLGLFAVLRDRRSQLALAAPIAYFIATSLLVSMSRFRLPMVPLLIVLAAGALAGDRSGWGRPRALVPLSLTWLVLAFLWWVDLPEMLSILSIGLNPPA